LAASAPVSGSLRRIRAAAPLKRIGEVVGGAAAMGYLRGMREKEGKDFNLPKTTLDMELLVGMGLSGAALFELFGKWDDDAINVGSGMLAHYAGQVFRNYGKTGKMTPLVAGHNYPAHGMRYPERLMPGVGGAADLIGAEHMSDALRSALSASGV
jgi:hypothetical protein